MNIENAIAFTEDAWANSQLSIVRHLGRVRFNGNEYIIVNKDGKDVFECTMEAERAGRDKAIPAGEPCDLVDVKYVKEYRTLGRDKFYEKYKHRFVGAKDLRV